MEQQDRFLTQLRSEFDCVFHTRIPARALAHTDAIVMLSGRVITVKGRITSKERENRSRIRFAISLQQRTARLRRPATKQGRVLRGYAPLYLIGTTEQLTDLREMAEEMGCLGEPTLLDCGPIGRANTQTQFVAINEHFRLSGAGHITVVTSRFHVPRVARTADRWLSERMDFSVVGAPEGLSEVDIESILQREAGRIIEYGQHGDLNVRPKRSGSVERRMVDRKVKT